MRQAIAEEVPGTASSRRQQRAATLLRSRPRAAPKPPTGGARSCSGSFVVPGNLDVATVEGQECELTAGDIITRLDDTPDSNNKVRVSASSSKRPDCCCGIYANGRCERVARDAKSIPARRLIPDLTRFRIVRVRAACHLLPTRAHRLGKFQRRGRTGTRWRAPLQAQQLQANQAEVASRARGCPRRAKLELTPWSAGGTVGALEAAEKRFQAVIPSGDFMILRLAAVHESG